MKIKIVIGIVILVALGWITWPYYALYDFANGVRQGDQVALEGRVAWDSVRQGLRDDLNAVFLQNLNKNDSATSALGTGFVALVGPTIINNVIDSYVTPRDIANLIQRGKPSILNAAQTENSAANQSSRLDDKQQDRLHWEQVRYAFFSGGPLTFRVDITTDDAQSGQRPVTLLFKWAGDWKLSRLFLPLDASQFVQPPRRESADDKFVQPPGRVLSEDEIGALRARLAKLWTVPAGAKNPEELVVRMRLRLNRDGTLIGPPVVLTAGSSPLYLASRDSALRALNRAQPFTMLQSEHYEAWKEIEITFDPRQKL